MKAQLFFSALFSAFIFQVFAQSIPNSGFENWILQPGGYDDPDGWETNNLSNGVSVSKTFDSHSGNYALQVINNYPGFEGPLSGYATTTFSDSQLMNKVLAYVKCDSISGNGGLGTIAVVGYLGGAWQYIGQWQTDTMILQYTLIDIPLLPVVQYDSIGIYILALGLRDTFGFNPGHVRLIVDEISIETVSGTTELDNFQTLKIVPNPFEETGNLFFKYPANVYCQISVYDNIGKLVQTFQGFANSPIYIERKNLFDGIYYFQVHSESNFIGAGKFILQKTD